MKLFEFRPASQNQRFIRACIWGIPLSILLGMIYGLITRLLGGIELSVVFILIGLLIANLIKEIGRGVQTRFKILAVLCYLITLLIGDIVFYAMLSNLPIFELVKIRIVYYLSGDIHGLVALLFRILGGIVCYQQSA